MNRILDNLEIELQSKQEQFLREAEEHAFRKQISYQQKSHDRHSKKEADQLCPTFCCCDIQGKASHI